MRRDICRDIRRDHIPLWNNWNSTEGLDEEDAVNLNEQVEGQMTIEQVLELFTQREEAVAARNTGEIRIPKEVVSELYGA